MPSSLDFLQEGHVESLLDTVGDGVVSIYAPMKPGSSGVQQNRLRWKTISTQIENKLTEFQVDSDLQRKTLNHVDSLIDDKEFWKQQSCGLASFISPDSVFHFRLHTQPNQAIAVDKRFNLRPLLPEINCNFRYYIITKDLLRFRLFHVECESVEELQPPRLPHELYHAMKVHQPHKADGSAGQMCSELMSKLQTFLTQKAEAPLLFAGAKADFKSFADSNQYKNFCHVRLESNGEVDNWNAVIRESHAVVCSRHEQRIETIVKTFRDWQDSDWASSDLHEICRAASVGQVRNLLVSKELSCFGSSLGEHQIDFATSSPTRRDHRDKDIVSLLISNTIRNGGRAFCVPPSSLPSTLDVVALFGKTE